MKSSVSQYNEEVCDDIFLLLADEMPLFVKDHNPDPSLIHSHLEHTHEEAEDEVGGSEEEVETDKESSESESGGEVNRDERSCMLDKELGVVRGSERETEEEGVGDGEGESEKAKENMKAVVKRKKRKSVKTVRRMDKLALDGREEVEEGREVLRRVMSRSRLVHRRRVSVQRRVRLSTGRSQRTPLKH